MSDIIQVNPLVFGGEGESVHANMLTTLWENPNPTASFASQDINLSSDDYDYTLWVARNYSTGTERNIMAIVRKGSSGMLFYSNAQNSGILTARRYMDRISDTSYTVGKTETEQGSATTPTENNAFIIPLAVYGFKKSLDITAIVSNVSTDATKCILSDNVTNVDDAVKYKLVTLTGTTTSVAANSYSTISLSGSVPSGYTPISIIKFESGNTGIDVELVSTSNMRVYNNTGSAKNAAPEVTVACVKSSIVS